MGGFLSVSGECAGISAVQLALSIFCKQWSQKSWTGSTLEASSSTRTWSKVSTTRLGILSLTQYLKSSAHHSSLSGVSLTMHLLVMLFIAALDSIMLSASVWLIMLFGWVFDWDYVLSGKEVSGLRLTYLLRPNVVQPDHQAAASLDTPPVTDLDDSSHFDSDSELASVLGDSDADSVVSHSAPVPTHDLSDIEEQSLSGEPDSDAWSVIGGSDADGEVSEGEYPLVTKLESLTTESDDPDRTLEAIPIQTIRQTSSRWQSYRSSSSPSRSPAPVTRRRPSRRDPSAGLKTTQTLYAYLYSWTITCFRPLTYLYTIADCCTIYWIHKSYKKRT